MSRRKRSRLRPRRAGVLGLPAVVACPASLETDVANVLIHESAHAVGIKPEEKPTDYAYRHERIYRALPTEHALKNADSYASFVRDIWFGVQPLGIPADVSRGCPDDWWTASNRHRARGAVEGRGLDGDDRADRYARWADARAKYLSDPGPAGLTQARRLFSSVAHRLCRAAAALVPRQGRRFLHVAGGVFHLAADRLRLPGLKGMEPDGHAMWGARSALRTPGRRGELDEEARLRTPLSPPARAVSLGGEDEQSRRKGRLTAAVPEGPGTPHTGKTSRPTSIRGRVNHCRAPPVQRSLGPARKRAAARCDNTVRRALRWPLRPDATDGRQAEAGAEVTGGDRVPRLPATREGRTRARRPGSARCGP